MDSIKPKRFSFAGFSNSFSKSLTFNTPIKKESVTVVAEPELKSKRNLRTKSLYIKSFKKPNSPTEVKNYDPSEATQNNSKEIRNSIRRSLSSVLYASPHSNEKTGGGSQLVPILVTSELSESTGGILIDEVDTNNLQEEEAEEEEGKKKKIEYDNTLEIYEENNLVHILWQGYAYTIDDKNKDITSELFLQGDYDMKDIIKDLQFRFEKEIWEKYNGLIHPVHLFHDDESNENIVNKGKWSGLSVKELRQYYDNYGSMMLKIRESRMKKQQIQYHQSSDKCTEWIIPLNQSNSENK